ncbi:MAG: hypothetical protein ACRBCS_15025 [Cellvibrionaceae bacterium]
MLVFPQETRDQLSTPQQHQDRDTINKTLQAREYQSFAACVVNS